MLSILGKCVKHFRKWKILLDVVSIVIKRNCKVNVVNDDEGAVGKGKVKILNIVQDSLDVINS